MAGTTTTAGLRLSGIDLNYGFVKALDDVDFEVKAGEVVAVLGDNGAGKSTLIMCISGVHRLDAGTIEIDGQPANITSPAAAGAHDTSSPPLVWGSVSSALSASAKPAGSVTSCP